MKAGVLNESPGSWGFGPLAKSLSELLEVDILEEPGDYNYLLHSNVKDLKRINSFIPYDAIEIAHDKRKQVGIFNSKKIPIPKTYLCTRPEIDEIMKEDRDKRWCVKYPTGEGATGHMVIHSAYDVDKDWPKPIILQEFIELEKPRVYRMYNAGGKLFGWNKREMGDDSSPWVAHAKGAKYFALDKPEKQVYDVASRTFEAVGLGDSFGSIDMMQDSKGKWKVLEVGTDGLFNYVDRDLGIPEIEKEIDYNLREAFWKKAKS